MEWYQINKMLHIGNSSIDVTDYTYGDILKDLYLIEDSEKEKILCYDRGTDTQKDSFSEMTKNDGDDSSSTDINIGITDSEPVTCYIKDDTQEPYPEADGKTNSESVVCYERDTNQFKTNEQADNIHYKPIVIDIEKEILQVRKVTERSKDFIILLNSRIWVNNKLDSNQEIYKKAKSFVTELVGVVTDIEKSIQINIVESGSYFNNLRVGLPDEFDFMLDLSPMFSILNSESRVAYSVKPIPQINDCEIKSSKNFYHIIAGKNSIFAGKNKAIDTVNLQTKLFSFCRKAVQVLKDKWNIVKFPTVSEKMATPAFEIHIMVNDIDVSIDLVPCFKFPTDTKKCIVPSLRKHTSNFLAKMNEEIDCNYVENIKDKLYLVCKFENNKGSSGQLFRLSTSIIEKDVFNVLDTKFLTVIRILKYLFQTFLTKVTLSYSAWETFEATRETSYVRGKTSYIPSYFFVNVILNVLCMDKDNEISKKSTEEITMLILELLQKIFYLEIPNIPELYNDDNLTMERLVVDINGWCFEDTNTISYYYNITECLQFQNYYEACKELLYRGIHLDDICKFPLESCYPVLCRDCLGKYYDHIIDLYSGLDLSTGYCFIHSFIKELS